MVFVEPERQERQKRDTRRVYWLLGFVVAGVLIVIGYQFLADDPPVADAAFLKDLNLPPKPVSNPLSEYQDWLDAHRPAWQLLFGGFTIARGFGEVTRDLAGISANPKIAGGAAFFEETNSHFERLAALLETDPKQWHWRSFSGGANVHMIRNEPSAISGVWDLLRARAGVLRAQNATAQALEECLLCLRFAELLEDRPGTTSHLSVVGRLRATAVENVAECLRRGPATTGSDLRRLRERLPRREGKSRMVRDALLCDYLTVRNSLKSLPHEQLVGSLPVSPAYSMLKRNRTTRLCLESSQAYEGALPAGLVAIEKEHRSLESRKRATGRFSWLPLRASNASGWEIWAALWTSFPPPSNAIPRRSLRWRSRAFSSPRESLSSPRGISRGTSRTSSPRSSSKSRKIHSSAGASSGRSPPRHSTLAERTAWTMGETSIRARPPRVA